MSIPLPAEITAYVAELRNAASLYGDPRLMDAAEFIERVAEGVAVHEADEETKAPPPPPSLSGAAEVTHDYLSTACFHGLHDRCRKQCKFCDVSCQCTCHAQLSEASLPVDGSRYMTTEEIAKAPGRIGSGVDDGWQLALKEPTPDMRIAGGIAWSNALPDAETYVDAADACYKAMLAAAPQPPRVTALCTFGPPAERRPMWILKFEAADMADMHFRDEAEAHSTFERASMNWNCALFVTAPASPPPPRVTVTEDEIAKLRADLATFVSNTDATENRVIDAEFAAQEAKHEAATFRVLLDRLFHSKPLHKDDLLYPLFTELSAITYKNGKQGVIDARALINQGRG